jgi:hypothetical protein
LQGLEKMNKELNVEILKEKLINMVDNPRLKSIRISNKTFLTAKKRDEIKLIYDIMANKKAEYDKITETKDEKVLNNDKDENPKKTKL